MKGYIKDIRRKKNSDIKKRRRFGAALCVLGIFFNLSLFFIKLFAGKASGSVAITADACNNLSDAAVCALTAAGFLLSSMKPTGRFPHGFGRIEYLFGLIVSAAVITVGIRLFISSVEKIFIPAPIECTSVTVILLLLSVAVKFVMFLYNRRFSKLLSSVGMKAAAADSLSDCVATLTILLSMAVYQLFSLSVDSICGVAVAGCIIYTGVVCAKDAALPLLGASCDKKTRGTILTAAKKIDSNIRIGEIFCHDYGPFSKTVCIIVSAESASGDDLISFQKAVERETGLVCTVCMVPG